MEPLVYCQERDIIGYAEQQAFPIIPCRLCGSQQNQTRARVKQLISELAEQNPKVPANMLNAIGNLRLSQLMDKRYWDFRGLEQGLHPLNGDQAGEKLQDEDTLPWESGQAVQIDCRSTAGEEHPVPLEPLLVSH